MSEMVFTGYEPITLEDGRSVGPDAIKLVHEAQRLYASFSRLEAEYEKVLAEKKNEAHEEWFAELVGSNKARREGILEDLLVVRAHMRRVKDDITSMGYTARDVRAVWSLTKDRAGAVLY